MQETRRTVLKRGGASVAALAGLAGCLGGGSGTETAASDSNDSGGDGADGSAATATPEPTPTGTATATPVAERPPTPAGDLTKWMPDPELLEQTSSSGYAFLAMAPKSIREFQGDLGSGALDQFEQEYPISGVGTLGEQTLIGRFARSVSVIVGEFDRTAVEDGLRTYGFEAGEARNGFRLFGAADGRAAAVRDGMLVTVGSVSSSDDSDKRPVVEAVVDARTGTATQYVDAVPDCARLLDAIGSAHVLQGRTHETEKTFEQGVGEGLGYHVAADRTRSHAAAVFTEGNANRSGMADWAADAEALLGGEPTVRTDGRVVTATSFAPTGDVTGFPGAFPGPAIERDDPAGVPPQVSFAFDYEQTGDGKGLLTVRHEGGDTVASDALRVQGSGFASVDGVDQTSAGPWQGEASGDDGGVVAGDAVAVGVTSDYEISVVWSPPDGDTSATLAEDEGPAA